MGSRQSYLLLLVRQVLDEFLQKNPLTELPVPVEETARTIYALAEQNLRSGRFVRFAKKEHGGGQLTLRGYVLYLTRYWIQDGARWQRLREQDPLAWDKFRSKLRLAARTLLASHPPTFSRANEPEDYVQQACIKILDPRTAYPFDVPLDLWATTILRNLIRERVRKKKDLLDRPHHDLEAHPSDPLADPFADPLEIADPTVPPMFEAIEDRGQFRNLIAGLEGQRAVVILLTFLHEWQDHEIAAYLETTKANIQLLRNRALNQLAKKLGVTKVKGKRPRQHQKSTGKRKSRKK